MAVSGDGPAPASAGSGAPFFLVGAERSGTTLLRLMLSHHPRIACAPEFEFVVDRLPAAGGWPDPAEYRAYLSLDRIFQAHRFAVDPALDYPALVRSFLAQFAARSGRPIVGATCHRRFDRLDELWPGARFVHLLRDGRDVARSNIGMGWEGNVWHAADRWIDAVERWTGLRARLSADRRLEVRYEALVAAPERVLGELCAFLGTAFDPAMLRYDADSTYARPDPRLIHQWRRELSPRELALLERRIGGLLRAQGYEPSGVAPARVGTLGRIGLRLDNRWRRFAFARRRYGFGLLLAGWTSRRLGWNGLRKKVILARNEIDARHLK
ncbi:MAG: sulfotransferase [Planctomycetota bacterium]